ncbi:hypothetical protein FA95DRAFT_759239 [Auriscalpium vulgare]|uniref:Uncharacterized protein n=1 Tax=Auriscalpium vulgare TaxID=40419 RepID=A0ACB8S1C9_9AGAM|nr:hypothetical protein FA95DRAFT_759239 [Auriscalpium vulgare]
MDLNHPCHAPAPFRPPGETNPFRYAAIAADRLHPRILCHPFQRDNFLFDIYLDIWLDNWKEWNRQLDALVMESQGSLYHRGAVPRPNPLLEPIATKNWDLNDIAILSVMRVRCSEGAADLIETATTSAEAYRLLEDHRQSKNQYRQVMLILQAQKITFPENEAGGVTFDAVAASIKKLVDRIFDRGDINKETLGLALHLNGLSRSHPALFERLCGDLARGALSVAKISCHLSVLSLTEKSCSLAPPPDARARQVCANCKKTSHTAEFCIARGGAMEGRSIQAAARAARRRRTYVHNGQTYILASPTTPAPPYST